MDIASIVFTQIAVGVIFALIVGLLAKRKQRNVFLWVVAGLLSGLITLIGLAFFHGLDNLPEEKREQSQYREKVFCWIMIGLGVLLVILRLLM